MSSLIVQVCRVDEIIPQPQADKLAIAVVKGWRSCIKRDPETGVTDFNVGDKCVYFPPDCILPAALSDRLGVTNYLAQLAKNPDGTRPSGGRVKVARLRGVQSYGFIIACENPEWEIGTNVADFYGITKWEPPERCEDGDADKPLPHFHKYTDIENYRNFPEVIKDGEEVIFSEKCHGKNSRCAYVRVPDKDGNETFEFTAGSHDVRRKEYAVHVKVVKDSAKENILDENGKPKTVTKTVRSQFWDAMDKQPKLKDMMKAISEDKKNVIVFGELYGSKIQDMTYGLSNGEWDFVTFDIAVDGKYLDYDEKMEWFNKFGIRTVPILYRGPFSREKVEEFVDGPTTVCDPDKAGLFKGREGIVITPVKGRHDFNLSGSGRVILKAISFDYSNRKGGSEYH